MTTQDLYESNIKLLRDLNIEYKECSSEPVLSYETAEKVRNEFGLTGAESKNLFLKAKNGKYYMFVSLQGKRADFDKLKQIIGAKISVASQDELTAQTGCEPYCAIPFGYPKDIGIIIDSEIYNSEKFIYSPGPPDKTIEIATKDIGKIFDSLANDKIRI